MALKENDVVMCTVKKVDGTTVFIETEDKQSGSIVFSEIAAGRIRNIREYVHPEKKIVCKVLKIYPDHVELSLRRVTGKEREEIQERFKKEKIFQNMIKAICPDYLAVISKIKEKYEIWDFFDQVKENSSLLEKYLKKSEYEAITKSLADRKDREKIIKKTIILRSDSESGLTDIKEIMNVKGVGMHYLGSSNFMVEAKARDYKEAELLLNNAIKEMEIKAKEKKAFFEVKEII